MSTTLNQSLPQATHSNLLPWVMVVTASGVLLVSIAYAETKLLADWAMPLFWLGLLVMFLPATYRLLAIQLTRSERVGLLVWLGLALFWVKFLQSPQAFVIHDEFAHWRTTEDILRFQGLFASNPLKPLSPFFPGLELITAAMTSLGNTSVFVAGTIVLAVARVILIIGLFFLYEHLTESTRIASVGTLIYFANPNFLFFSAQYAYESLALPLAVLVLSVIVRQSRLCKENHPGWTAIVLLLLAATVVTHHLASYLLVGLLWLWSVSPAIVNGTAQFFAWYSGTGVLPEFGTRRLVAAARRSLTRSVAPGIQEAQLPGSLWIVAMVLCVAWLTYVAVLTAQALWPHLARGISETVQLMGRETEVRQLFQSGGQTAPWWYRWLGFASVGVVLVGLTAGWPLAWRQYRQQALGLALCLGALAYPVSLLIRLTPHGWELSNRTSEFLFVPIGYVLAVGAIHVLRPQTDKWLRVLVSILVTIAFMGGVCVGWPIWSLLPGPYLVADGSRSIESEGIATALWTQEHLGPDNRLATDRVNGRLQGSYGMQHPVTAYSDGIATAPVFFAAEFGKIEQAILRKADVRFLIVDLRLSSSLPLVGVYFEDGEPGSSAHTTPISLAVLQKFDDIPNVSRIYTSGSLNVFDVSQVTLDHRQGSSQPSLTADR